MTTNPKIGRGYPIEGDYMTPAPTQGHTKEPWMWGHVFTDSDDHRARLCVNACAGLTAEQVAGIPKLVEGFGAASELIKGGGGFKSVHAKLKAFEAMREALAHIVHADPGSGSSIVARATLKLVERSEIPSTDGADDCEATP